MKPTPNDFVESNSPTVLVGPRGIEFSIAANETVFEAAERAGYSWPSVCDKQGACSACALDVISSEAVLPPASNAELETLALLPRFQPGDESVRLACQLRPTGDLVVKKPGVRPRD